MPRQTLRILGLAATLAFTATAAMAQTGAPGGAAGSPGGQLRGEGFFVPSSGAGVGAGGVGSPINTNQAPAGLFGPGGFFANAKPVTSGAGTPAGVQLVDSPAAANGTSNASAPTGAGGVTTAARPNLGGVGPRRFLSPG